jgi:hypothetical protein
LFGSLRHGGAVHVRRKGDGLAFEFEPVEKSGGSAGDEAGKPEIVPAG